MCVVFQYLCVYETDVYTLDGPYGSPAGMLALFLEWKKSGANAEMYIYDDGQGPFGPGDDHSTSGAWREHFYRWLVSNGWVN